MEEVTRAEFTEFSKRMDEANERLGKRITLVEGDMKDLHNLTIAVEKMAVSLESMVTEQKSQNERLEKLEGKDGETWTTVRGCIITGVVSILLGYIAAHMGM